MRRAFERIKGIISNMKRDEKLFFWLSIVILLAGGIAEIINKRFCIIVIEAGSFNGICTSIVGVQASVSVVTFSLISVFSNFHTTERYGIHVVRYLIKYRNKVLNQSNVFFLEMILLVISVVHLFFGWINLIFCNCVVSILLVTYLARESFLLYRMEDIDEEMFSFLKENLQNKGFNLLKEYLISERRHLENGDYKGRKPASRLDELWKYEIEKNKYSLYSFDFREVHESFTLLVNDYLKNNEQLVRNYGVEIAYNIIHKYSSIRKLDIKEKDGSSFDEYVSMLELDSFNEWKESLAGILYTDNSQMNEISSLVEEISKIEEVFFKRNKYEKGDVDAFSKSLINKASISKTNMNVFAAIYVNCLEYYIKNAEDHSNRVIKHVIFFVLYMIDAGYLKIIEESFFDSFKPRQNNKNNKVLYGVIFGYFYYLVFDGRGTEQNSELKNKQDDILKLLKNNFSYVRCFGGDNQFSFNETQDIIEYIANHKNISKYAEERNNIESSVLKSIIFFQKIGSGGLSNDGVEQLVKGDWTSIYPLIVGNDCSKKEFLSLDWMKYDGEDFDEIYQKLEKEVYEYSLEEINSDENVITEGDIIGFKEYLERKSKECSEILSINSINNVTTCTINTYKSILYFKDLNEQDNWYKITNRVYFNLLSTICFSFKLKLKKVIVSDHSGAQECLSSADDYDYRIGDPNSPLYEKDYRLFSNIRKTVPFGYNTIEVEENPHVLIYAKKEKISVSVSIIEVILRELSDEEILSDCQKQNGKYEKLFGLVNFCFEKSDYIQYMKKRRRMLEVRYSVAVSADENAGICYTFKPASN